MADASLSQFSGQWFVVKIGGELAANPPALARSVGRSIRAFLDAGIRVAVIHGGGAQITDLSTKLGIKTVQVAGRRVTDAQTLEVLKLTVAGQVSVDVAVAMRLAQVPAVCTTGVSAGLVDAVRRPPQILEGPGSAPVDLGLVGDITTVDTKLLERLSSAGVVPVMGCLAGNAAGEVFNVNADTVATRVAAQLKATKLFLVSSVTGVLRDRNDPSTRIPRLTRAEAHAQISSGVIQGGMIPKVEESLAMLDQGIGAIHIVGTTPDDAMIVEALSPGKCGTAFVS